MNLQLSLKSKWFEMTKAGIKTEDYREITPYWRKRILKHYKNYTPEQLQYFSKYYPNDVFKKFSTNTMTSGYPKSTDTERILKFEHKGIEIRTGNPEWGAEPDKLYFVIKHGKKL